MQKEVEKIIKDISLRHGVPYEVAKTIVYSQFECARNEITKGEHDNLESFKTVHFKHLGKMFPSAMKLSVIKSKKNADKQEQDSTGGDKTSL